MTDINVTNNHSGTLNVAGVDISAGGTAAVPEVKLKQWMNGHAAKVWADQGVVTFDGDVSDADEDNDEGGAEPTRDELMARARELGLNPNGNTGTDKLKAMIAEAEEEAE